MTTQTTQNTNATAKTNNEAGAIWIKETEKGNMLNIILNGQRFTGFAVQEKKSESAPDYNIVKFTDETDENGKVVTALAGAAWVSTTQDDQPLLKLKVYGVYHNAIFRKVVEGQSSKRADMTIFKSNAAAKADKKAVATV